MLKLCFYVPESHLESTKAAVFAAGAGKIGDYEQCCWQVRGTGQFTPVVGSNPFIGTHDKLEMVDEYRVELVCRNDIIKRVIEALKSAHPYEEPAYDVIELINI